MPLATRTWRTLAGSCSLSWRWCVQSTNRFSVPPSRSETDRTSQPCTHSHLWSWNSVCSRWHRRVRIARSRPSSSRGSAAACVTITSHASRTTRRPSAAHASRTASACLYQCLPEAYSNQNRTFFYIIPYSTAQREDPLVEEFEAAVNQSAFPRADDLASIATMNLMPSTVSMYVLQLSSRRVLFSSHGQLCT
jgi:hypothetical protein